jgi:hypothetical protein
LFVTQWPVQLNIHLDPIDLPFLAFAFGAIFGMDAGMTKPGSDALERQTFSLGVHGEGNCRARSKRRQQ